VMVSRVTTILIMLISIIVTNYINTISGAWSFIIEAGAGLGLVLILRWFWWRINAWSEITAMVTPLFVYGYLYTQTNIKSPNTLFIIVGITTVSWIIVTFLTQPTNETTLLNFYRRVHPGGIGWKRIAAKLPDVQGDTGYGNLFVCWILGIILVYAFLFGIGKVVLKNYSIGFIFLAVGICAGFGINHFLNKQKIT
jgi:SSS family solute:Na+ symporter